MGKRIEHFIKMTHNKVSLVDLQMSFVRDHMLLSLLHKFFLKKGDLIHLGRQEHVRNSCQLLTKCLDADINLYSVLAFGGRSVSHMSCLFFSDL